MPNLGLSHDLHDLAVDVFSVTGSAATIESLTGTTGQLGAGTTCIPPCSACSGNCYCCSPCSCTDPV